MTTKTKVATGPLNADVYDALEFSALVFGGIGAGTWFNGVNDFDADLSIPLAPCCGGGHAISVCDVTTNHRFVNTEALTALQSIGVNYCENDEAVQAINARLGRDSDTPVTFKQWAKELGIVRAEYIPAIEAFVA